MSVALAACSLLLVWSAASHKYSAQFGAIPFAEFDHHSLDPDNSGNPPCLWPADVAIHGFMALALVACCTSLDCEQERG